MPKIRANKYFICLGLICLVWDSAAHPDAGFKTPLVEVFRIFQIRGESPFFQKSSWPAGVEASSVEFSKPVEPDSIPVSCCGAFIDQGIWKEWMCYNLGVSDSKANPFTPGWEINGGYWQWGRKEMAGPGPTGPEVVQSNQGAIAGWKTDVSPGGSWADADKMSSDPCPPGYRIPTKADWEGVIANNSSTNYGSTWTVDASNFSTGKKFGDNLFLPASGYRLSFNGGLSNRGAYGLYWSSTEHESYNAWYLALLRGLATLFDDYRGLGLSLRCISVHSSNGSRVSLPKVSTDMVGLVAPGNATAGGAVISDGGAFVTARGIVWSTDSPPGINLPTKTSDGSGAGNFNSQLTGLLPDTKYYIRAYATNCAGTAYGSEVAFVTPSELPDSTKVSRCGAFIAMGVWREFMCHNLGAVNTSADPFTPRWEINGGYWQWGRKGMAASGPVGPGVGQENSMEINGWNAMITPNSSWRDSSKTSADPCPPDFRLPTKAEWEGVIANNAIEEIGNSWTEHATNYSTGKRFGGKLHLPAAGGRGSSDGKLLFRGMDGSYWSSSENAVDRGWGLGFSSGNTSLFMYPRTAGLSVRCIGEKPYSGIVLPWVVTDSITAITANGAKGGGTVTNGGVTSVTTRGVVWSTFKNPEVMLTTKTTDGNGSGSFSSTLTNLQPNTIYYVRAYATNSAGTAYGNEVSFKTLLYTDSATIVMKEIPAGTFSMGCTEGDKECRSDEQPVRKVTLSAFLIGETEITQSQYKAVMGSNPVGLISCPSCPVESVSWFDAVVFCNRLSELQGLRPHYYANAELTQVYGKIGGNWALPNSGMVFMDTAARSYRLPTEAEWEYAARGGDNTSIYSGGDSLGILGWFKDNSGLKIQPVKGKQANKFGLYDMSGNIREWCHDWYSPYPDLAQINPTGPSIGLPWNMRLHRGGNYFSGASSCRVSDRVVSTPSFRSSGHGFRVVRRL